MKWKIKKIKQNKIDGEPNASLCGFGLYVWRPISIERCACAYRESHTQLIRRRVRLIGKIRFGWKRRCADFMASCFRKMQIYTQTHVCCGKAYANTRAQRQHSGLTYCYARWLRCQFILYKMFWCMTSFLPIFWLPCFVIYSVDGIIWFSNWHCLAPRILDGLAGNYVYERCFVCLNTVGTMTSNRRQYVSQTLCRTEFYQIIIDLCVDKFREAHTSTRTLSPENCNITDCTCHHKSCSIIWFGVEYHTAVTHERNSCACRTMWMAAVLSKIHVRHIHILWSMRILVWIGMQSMLNSLKEPLIRSANNNYSQRLPTEIDWNQEDVLEFDHRSIVMS